MHHSEPNSPKAAPRDPELPPQFGRGKEVIVLWESGGIDFSCAGDLLEFRVDNVELVFADMRRAVGHAEVEPGVVAVGHLLELFADNGFGDGAGAGEVFGSGEAFYGEGLEAVAELGAVF